MILLQAYDETSEVERERATDGNNISRFVPHFTAHIPLESQPCANSTRHDSRFVAYTLYQTTRFVAYTLCRSPHQTRTLLELSAAAAAGAGLLRLLRRRAAPDDVDDDSAAAPCDDDDSAV